MGINTQVSDDGGATFHTPQRAQIDPAYAGSGSQHNYFDPVPPGVTQVIVKAGYARDFSIVSQTLGGSSPPTPTVNPTDTPLPTANPTNTPTFVPSTPTPVTIPLNNTPCTVTLGTGQQTGHCSGTFTP
jgi:hypothetical protein